MRVARLSGSPRPPLVLAAHGSRDPGFAEVIDAVAAQVRAARAALDVQIGYLDHGPPLLAELDTAGAVVVPLLLASGYHVRVDIPAQAPRAAVTAAVGPDPRLAEALRDRLVQAGFEGSRPVVLAAAGSSDPTALADVAESAEQLAALLDVPVAPAFVSAGEPRLSAVDVSAAAVASYLLCPGVFHDEVLACGASVVSAPLGAHAVIAQIVLARYELGASNQASPA